MNCPEPGCRRPGIWFHTAKRFNAKTGREMKTHWMKCAAGHSWTEWAKENGH